MYNGFVESEERVAARLEKINRIGDVEKMKAMKDLAARAGEHVEEKTLAELVEEMKARTADLPAVPRRLSWFERHPIVTGGTIAGVIMAIVRAML